MKPYNKLFITFNKQNIFTFGCFMDIIRTLLGIFFQNITMQGKGLL